MQLALPARAGTARMSDETGARPALIIRYRPPAYFEALYGTAVQVIATHDPDANITVINKEVFDAATPLERRALQRNRKPVLHRL
jgi:hypothetical protein